MLADKKCWGQKLEAGKKLGAKNIGPIFCWYKASYRVKIRLHTENQLPRYCGSGLNMYGFGFCCAAVLTAFCCLEQQQHRVSLVGGGGWWVTYP